MGKPLFDARRRARQRNLAGLTLFVAGTLPFMVGLVVLDVVPYLEKSHFGTMMAAGLMGVAALLTWSLQSRMALLGNAELRRELRHSLEAGADAEFVGFAPGHEIRSWEGETDQDVGFLSVEGRMLVYRGDRYSWSLPREGIDDIRLLVFGDEAAQPMAPVRVAVYWHGQREPGRTFTLSSRSEDALIPANQATRRLAEQLREWWRSEEESGESGPWPGLPLTDLRGSYPVDRPAPGSCLSALALGIIAASLLWQTTWTMLRLGNYNRAVLWAGLILMGGIICTAHVLSYLQVHQGRVESPPGPST